MASDANMVVEFLREGGPQIGDLIYWDGAKWVTLPAGVDGQILVVGNSGLPEWQDPA